MALEATRKITSIFVQLLAAPNNENQTLKAKVGQLEYKLKTITEDYESARVWRENVLSGCPVLFEQTGLIFTLKPFGKFVRQADEVTKRNPESSPAAGLKPGNDAGVFVLNDINHV